jgi:hypothetical protein
MHNYSRQPDAHAVFSGSGRRNMADCQHAGMVRVQICRWSEFAIGFKPGGNSRLSTDAPSATRSAARFGSHLRAAASLACRRPWRFCVRTLSHVGGCGAGGCWSPPPPSSPTQTSEGLARLICSSANRSGGGRRWASSLELRAHRNDSSIAFNSVGYQFADRQGLARLSGGFNTIEHRE